MGEREKLDTTSSSRPLTHSLIPELPESLSFARAAFALVNTCSIISPAVSYARHYAPAHAYVSVFARHSVFFGENPHSACSIIYLEYAIAERAIRACDSSDYCDFFILIAARIGGYLRDILARWAGSESERHNSNRETEKDSALTHLFCYPPR